VLDPRLLGDVFGRFFDLMKELARHNDPFVILALIAAAFYALILGLVAVVPGGNPGITIPLLSIIPGVSFWKAIDRMTERAIQRDLDARMHRVKDVMGDETWSADRPGDGSDLLPGSDDAES
jgi:hypothetical protein